MDYLAWKSLYPDKVAKVLLHPPKSRALTAIVGGIALVAAGVWVLHSGLKPMDVNLNPLGWVLIVAGALLIPIGLLNLIPGLVLLELTDRGFRFRGLITRIEARWSDVKIFAACSTTQSH